MTRLPADAAVRARGRVEKRGGRYRLALDIATASTRGERALDAPTCEALASSAAVVIAMSVAPSPSDDPPPADPAPASTPAPAAERTQDVPPQTNPGRSAPNEPRTVAPEPDRAAVASESPRFLARAHVIGDSGLLPEATVGGGFAFGLLAWRDLSVEVGASLWASRDGTVAGAPGRGASFSLFSGGARACWTLTHGIEVAPCIGAEVARISASGFGAAKVSDADALVWGPEGLVAGRIPVAGPVSVRLGLGAFVPMSRQSFVISAAGTVHRPAVVALRTFAGPEVRF